MQSTVLLATVPIVPVGPYRDYKLGYIIGPVLAGMAILGFFGALFWLQVEKARDIHFNQNGKAKPRSAVFTALFWRRLFTGQMWRDAARARAARREERLAAKAAAEQQV